ncbi:hypothetical protein NPIL_350501 [Nephila pilipes]|uniref:Uncharacterized protein n=1 Tax=Nephila pilipes TaxID=299642 RepID=A0A8X6MBX9_NEPPI|nr:hypothetical protein NPIL_350501 [Nephila pilipes]
MVTFRETASEMLLTHICRRTVKAFADNRWQTMINTRWHANPVRNKPSVEFLAGCTPERVTWGSDSFCFGTRWLLPELSAFRIERMRRSGLPESVARNSRQL